MHHQNLNTRVRMLSGVTTIVIVGRGNFEIERAVGAKDLVASPPCDVSRYYDGIQKFH
jgi:hypothetical protein